MINSKRKGLTLLEVLVATVLMALIVASLANVFIVGKRLVQHNRSRATSSGLSNVFLEDLQMQVRQDQWATNQLGGTGIIPTRTETTSDGKTYTVNYAPVATVVGTTLKRVQADVVWTELPP